MAAQSAVAPAEGPARVAPVAAAHLAARTQDQVWLLQAVDGTSGALVRIPAAAVLTLTLASAHQAQAPASDASVQILTSGLPAQILTSELQTEILTPAARDQTPASGAPGAARIAVAPKVE
jgi:hypothetical protein